MAVGRIAAKIAKKGVGAYLSEVTQATLGMSGAAIGPRSIASRPSTRSDAPAENATDAISNLNSHAQRIDASLQQNNQLLSEIINLQKANLERANAMRSGGDDGPDIDIHRRAKGRGRGRLGRTIRGAGRASGRGLGMAGRALANPYVLGGAAAAAAGYGAYKLMEHNSHIADPAAHEKELQEKYGPEVVAKAHEAQRHTKDNENTKNTPLERHDFMAGWQNPGGRTVERQKQEFRELEGTLKNPAKKLAAGMSPVAFSDGFQTEQSNESLKITANEIIFRGDTITFDIGAGKGTGASGGFSRGGGGGGFGGGGFRQVAFSPSGGGGGGFSSGGFSGGSVGSSSAPNFQSMLGAPGAGFGGSSGVGSGGGGGGSMGSGAPSGGGSSGPSVASLGPSGSGGGGHAGHSHGGSVGSDRESVGSGAIAGRPNLQGADLPTALPAESERLYRAGGRVDGMDKSLVHLSKEASKDLPPGYRAEMISGHDARSTGTTNHPNGLAMDIKIYDDKGKVVPHDRGGPGMAIYEKYHQSMVERGKVLYPKNQYIRGGAWQSSAAGNGEPMHMQRRIPGIGSQSSGKYNENTGIAKGHDFQKHMMQPDELKAYKESIRAKAGAEYKGPATPEQTAAANAAKVSATNDAVSIRPGEAKVGGEGSSPYRAEQRAKYIAEIEANPALKQKLAVLLEKEAGHDPKDQQRVFESMLNRTHHEQGNRPDAVSRAMHNGFYAPINKGKVDADIAAGRDPTNTPLFKGVYDKVKGGSDDLEGRSNQGMGSDRSRPWAPGEKEMRRYKGDPNKGNVYYDKEGIPTSKVREDLAAQKAYDSAYASNQAKKAAVAGIPMPEEAPRSGLEAPKPVDAAPAAPVPPTPSAKSSVTVNLTSRAAGGGSSAASAPAESAAPAPMPPVEPPKASNPTTQSDTTTKNEE